MPTIFLKDLPTDCSLFAQTSATTLPPELKSAIATLCSKDSLPRLALVSKESQILAESLLYAAIVIRTYNGQIGALATLATSPRRASYVKFLSVEFYRISRTTDRSVIEWLLKAGPGMRNLKDMRLSLREDVKSSHLRDIHDLLWWVAPPPRHSRA